MANTLQVKVDQWLKEIGCTPVIIDQPEFVYNVRIDYPMKTESMMQVLIQKGQPDAVTIAMGVVLLPQHRTSFDRMHEDEQETFNWELRQRLNNIDAEFKLEVPTGKEFPERFQVMRTRYEDGLTKDGFMFSIGAVYKTYLKGVWFVQKELNAPDFGGGGRFDFRRAGL